MLVRQGTCIRLESLTPPAGMLPVLPALEESIELAPGEDFGDDGLLDALSRLGSGTALEVCEGIVKEVRNHVREQRQPDDITLIAMKVL